MLRDVDVLRSLAPEPLERLASRAIEESYDEDETIYRTGSRSDALYVVRDGAVGVYTDFVGQRVEFLDRITSGGVFGEMGVLEDSPRSASACAMGGATVLKMDAEAVREVLDNDATFAIRLAVKAISLHCIGPSSKLRYERRTPIDRELLLACGRGGPWRVRLIDLSPAGARLRGVPEIAGLETAGAWRLLDDHERELFTTQVEVIWRQGATVGVRFLNRSASHERRVGRLLDRLAA